MTSSDCRLRRRTVGVAACGILLLALSSIGHPDADAQEALATVDQPKKLYCRYRNPQTFKEKTGWVPGLKSCDEGDAAMQVAYHPCDEDKIIPVARGDLTKNEPNCDGAPTTPNEFATVINAKIVAVKGDDVVIAYGTASGEKQVSLKGYNLKGLKPEVNSHIVFFSTDPGKKTDPRLLATSFEKFKLDASQGGAIKGPQSIVGVVTSR